MFGNRQLWYNVYSRLKDGKFRFSVFAMQVFRSNSSLVRFDSRESLLEFHELGSLIELSDENEDLLYLLLWSLRSFLLSLCSCSVLARWFLGSLRYLSSSDIRDERHSDSSNVHALSVNSSFSSVSPTCFSRFCE